MEIRTKFKINDEVWFLHPASLKVVSGRIKEIRIQVGSRPKYRTGERRDLIKTGEYIEQLFVNMYTVDDNVRKEGCSKGEFDLFNSKEEAIQSCIERINS